MTTIGTLAYRITANVAGMQAGAMATRAELRSLRTGFVDTSSTADRLSGAVQRLNDLQASGLDPRLYAAGIRSIGQEALQSTPLVGALAAKMTALAIAMVGVYAAFKAGSHANEFNKAMNNSLSIMEDVSESMRRRMTDVAVEIGTITRSTAIESAKGYRSLASAGLDAAQSLEALPITAKFAQAGMFDLDRATTLAVGSQAALGKVVKDPIQNMKNLTRITDLLTHANNIAIGSVEDFAAALATGTAASLRVVNKDAEEGLAVLTAYASQMVMGEEAGTQFSIVLRDLQTKAIKNAEMFEAYGVAVFDSTGKMNNFADILRDIEVLLDGLSDKDKKSALLNLGFMDKSVLSLLKITGMSEKIREAEASFRSMSGAVEQVAGKQLTEFEKGMKAINGEISRFNIKIITPMVEAFGKALQFVVSVWNGGYGSLLQFTSRLAMFVTVLGTTVLAVEGLVRIFNLLRLAYNALIARQIVLQALSGPGGWITLGVGLGIAASATIGLMGALEKIDGPIRKTNEAAKDLTKSTENLKNQTTTATQSVQNLASRTKQLRDINEQYQESLRRSNRLLEQGNSVAGYAAVRTAEKERADSLAKLGFEQNSLWESTTENGQTVIRQYIEGNKLITQRIKLTEQQAITQRLLMGPGSDPNSPESTQYQSKFKQLPKGPPTEDELKQIAKRNKITFDAIEESGKAYDRMMKRGEDMARKMRTPFEEMKDAIADANYLFEQGAINAITKFRFINAEKEKYLHSIESQRKKLGEDKQDIKAIESGTQEAFAADFRRAIEDDAAKLEEELEVSKDLLAEARKQTGELEEIKREFNLDFIQVHID